MSMNSIKAFGLSVAVATGLMGFAAQTVNADEGRFYIVPGVQWMDFDSMRQSDDETGYTLGIGYGLTDNLAAELNYTRISGMNTLAGRDRLRALRLDMLYTVDNSIGVMSPFFVGGLGDSKFDSNHDTTLNLGAGVKYRFNDRIEWRTAARTFFGFDDGTYDFGIDTGLLFRLGAAPAPARVEPSPMPAAVQVVDTDGDGVPDDRDACPNTPRNYAVDERGCPIVIEEVARIELSVQFEFDQSDVRAEYFDDIRRVADFLSQHDDVVAELEGHTCNIGPASYNMGLSERRASSVRSFLVNEGVPADRITTQGFGLTQPRFDNNTREGRSLNRRVEIRFE